MPGKKKKGGKKGGERPPLGGPTDSLRADIAAARDGKPHNPFVDGEGGDDDGDDDDIAAQLLASLDARDEAEAQAKAPPAAKPVPVPNAHGDQLSPQTSKDSNGHRHRSSSGVLSGLKEAGEKLLHPSRSPSSSISAGPGSSPNGAVNGEADSPSKSGGAIRSIFGGSSHRSSDPAIPETAVASGASPPQEGNDEPQRKMGRQKLRKQRKAAEAAADRARYEEELKANGGNVDEAALEKQGIDLACESLGVTMHEISPDGHCLYAAIADQYATHYRHKSNYQAMRKTTAQFMQFHRDDFLPFISDGDEKMAGISNPEAGKSGHGDEATKEDHFLAYCHAIENTGVWGGQPEILALSRALQVPIWVIQSGSPPVKIGQEEQGVVKGQQRQPLMLSYHRKMYGLGEHYNSLRPK